MFYAYANRLGAYKPGLDPDAAAYIAAVETAGATVTADQKNAINTFVKTGKSDGWYSSIKRLYLPIWASAAPNAVDMISRTSGTFNGTVDHSNVGYVQGDGVSGYFEIGNFTSLGVSIESIAIGCLINIATSVAGTAALISNFVAAGSQVELFQTDTQIRQNIGGTSINHALAKSSQVGIIVASRIDGVGYTFLRDSSGHSTLISASSTGGTIPNVSGNAMRSLFGGGSVYSDPGIGSIFQADGLSATTNAAFTLALKDLWETASGLTLP